MKKLNLFLIAVAFATLNFGLQTLNCFAQPGSLDASFGTGGKVTTPIGSGATGNSVAIQSDGKILVAGYNYNGYNSDFDL